MDRDSSSGTLVLPAYSPAIEIPRYTPEPRPGEERLQISGRLPAVPELTGVFVEKTKHVTLALTNQIPNCKEPSYGRGAVVQGAISPSRPEGIVSVEVKLEAVLVLSMTSVMISGDTFIPLFSKREVLFGKTEPKHSSFTLTRRVSHSQNSYSVVEEERCPLTLTFAVHIPTVYSHQGVSRALPPSYSDNFNTIPGLRLDSRYTLYITICRKALLGRDKRTVLTQPIIFAPRSRPANPALPTSLSFLSTLKSSPEEWKLFEAETAVRDGDDGTPTVSSALFLPRSQVYPINHSIPFHLQLSCASADALAQYAPRGSQNTRSSTSHSLLHFSMSSSMNTLPLRFSQYPNPNPLRKDQARSTFLSTELGASGEPSSFGSSTHDVEDKGSGRIYLSVQRHVAVEVMGQWLQLKKTLSTSTFKRCPNFPGIGGHACAAWEGHINVMAESRCGGFGGPGVQVKDYILLSVIPPDSDHSPLREIRHLVPIQLTTDSYSEDVVMSDIELTRYAS